MLGLAGYIGFRLIAPAVPLPEHLPQPVLLLLMLASALAGIGFPVLAMLGLARLMHGYLRPLGLMAVGGLAWLLLASLPAAADTGKILLAGGAGILLARLLREPNILLPALVFAAFADFVVVRWGTVHQALRPGNEAGQKLVKSISAEVPRLHPSLPLLTIGPADFLFIGLLLAAAVRFALAPRATAWSFVLVLTVSLALVPFLGAVPALAPMAVAFLAVNWRNLRLTKAEIGASAVVLLAAGGLFWAFFALRR